MTQDEINAVKKAAEKMRKKESAQNEIIEMARQAGVEDSDEYNHLICTEVELIAFANLVADKATEEANAKANASWELMCKKMVAIEREAYENDMEVLMNALWKACGDDAEVVNATIESQGELTRARGEQA
jgi:uncharacterized protein YceH (UPF0502 family)